MRGDLFFERRPDFDLCPDSGRSSALNYYFAQTNPKVSFRALNIARDATDEKKLECASAWSCRGLHAGWCQRARF
jgi:hypothetical protein